MARRWWIHVRLSKPHRRKGHWITNHWQRWTKAHRNKEHKRRNRRTYAEIAAANARASKCGK